MEDREEREQVWKQRLWMQESVSQGLSQALRWKEKTIKKLQKGIYASGLTYSSDSENTADHGESPGKLPPSAIGADIIVRSELKRPPPSSSDESSEDSPPRKRRALGNNKEEGRMGILTMAQLDSLFGTKAGPKNDDGVAGNSQSTSEAEFD